MGTVRTLIGTGLGDSQVRSRLTIRLHALVERFFPERRLFLRSDSDTRFIRLRSETQAVGFAGLTLLVGWSIVATSILLMDSIGAGNFRDQAKRDQETYQHRLNALSAERDARAAEALAAQDRFASALKQISVMQTELLNSEAHRRELETGIDVIQATLREVMKSREEATARLAELESDLKGEVALARASGDDATVKLLNEALTRVAEERDQVIADAQAALIRAAEMQAEIEILEDKNDRIFRQLEEAMTVSVAPLHKMFEKAGMDPDRILNEVRKGYSGQGGPLTPLSFSTKGDAPSPDDAARQPHPQSDGPAEPLPDRRPEGAFRLAAQGQLPLYQRFRLSLGSAARGHRFRRAARHAHLFHRRWRGHPRGLAVRIWPPCEGQTCVRHRDALCPLIQNPRQERPKGLARGSDR